MFPIDRTGPTVLDLESPYTPPVRQLTDTLIEVFKAGHFAPYQNKLGRTWKRLESLPNDEGYYFSSLQPLYLFALIIRCTCEKSKTATVNNYFSHLDTYDRVQFLTDLRANAPCVIMTILKYATPETRQDAYEHIFTLGWFQNPGDDVKIACDLIKEFIHEKESYPNGTEFLRLFQSSLDKVKELIYCFFSNSSPSEQEAFQTCLSEPLGAKISQTLNETKKKLESYYEAPLENHTEIPFGHERDYFLQLFFSDFLDNRQSFLVVVYFNDSDWTLLKNFLSDPLDDTISHQATANLTLCWLESMLYLLNDQANKALPRDFDMNLAGFFSLVGEALSSKLSPEQNADLAKIAQIISPDLLAKQYIFLPEILLQHLPPQTIVAGLSLCTSEKGSSEERVYGTPNEVWYQLSNVCGNDFMHTVCFKSNNPPVFELTLFSALGESTQADILTTLLKNSPQGIQKLCRWILYCLSKDETTLSLFTKLLIFQDLHNMLRKIDPHLVDILKADLEKLGVQIKQLNRLIPLKRTPEERQRKALKQLEKLLLNRSLVWNELVTLVERLHPDLEAKMKRSEWIPKLFDLPKSLWPALFVHFNKDLLYRRINVWDLTPIKLTPDFLSSTEKWLNIASQVILSALERPINNQEDQHLIERALYVLDELLSKTETMPQVIERLYILVPADKWIPFFDKLQKGMFRNTQEFFYVLLAQCIDQSQMNKIAFLVERFVAFNQARTVEPISSLEKALFDRPFITTPQEKLALVKMLINKLGFSLFLCCTHHKKLMATIMETIKSTPDQGRPILLKWMKKLSTLDRSQHEKSMIFDQIVLNYGQEAFNVFLQSPEYQLMMKEMLVVVHTRQGRPSEYKESINGS